MQVPPVGCVHGPVGERIEDAAEPLFVVCFNSNKIGGRKRATLAGSRRSLLRPAVTTTESAFVHMPLLPSMVPTCQPVAASGHAAEDCALIEAALEV